MYKGQNNQVPEKISRQGFGVLCMSPHPPSAANKAVVRRRPQQCYAVTLLRVTVLPQQQTIADYAQHLVFRADEIPKNGSKKRIQSQNKDGARPT